MKSQNGWPALAADSEYLHTWAPFGIRTRNGSAGFLLAHLAHWFDDKIEAIEQPRLDDWGYAYRPIRGSVTTLSNHSSGTAIDLNATRHPRGIRGTFTDMQCAAIRTRLKLYEGCIRWGGDYTSPAIIDQMHFEIDKSLTECERVAHKLMGSVRGKKILDANPGQASVILS